MLTTSTRPILGSDIATRRVQAYVADPVAVPCRRYGVFQFGPAFALTAYSSSNFDYGGERRGQENEKRQETTFDKDQGSEASSEGRPQYGINVFPTPLLSHFRLAGGFVAPATSASI
jgi:hypothetical protein